MAILFVYLVMQGLNFHSFITDDDSPLIMKKKDIAAAKEAKKKVEAKLKESIAFVKSLETKKNELRGLATDLQGMKETLSERLDVPAFMKMTITEANKVGLNIVSLKPTGGKEKEYYAEKTFEMSFRGLFVQFIMFLDRISKVSEIIRTDKFSMKPRGPKTARFVELEGTIELKTYKYLGTKADSLDSLSNASEVKKSSSKIDNTLQSQTKGGT